MLNLLGLVTFIVVVVLNSSGLLLDLALLLQGRETITQLVRQAPGLGWPILALQILGVMGLILHFYAE